MIIYCDLDGVLVDFDKKIKSTFHMSVDKFFQENTDTEAWRKIDKIKDFWYDIDWTKDGKSLWNFLQKSKESVKILTTPAKQVKNCKKDKLKWVKENLGEDVEVIFSSKKEEYSNENSILIDDHNYNVDKFREKGGIGILYRTADETIRKLGKILNTKKKGEVLQQGDFITYGIEPSSGWEYIQIKPGVIVVPIRIVDNAFQVLLVREYNPLRRYETSVITGRYNQQESPESCAKRELQEETGYDIPEDRFITIGEIYYSKSDVVADQVVLAVITSEDIVSATNPDGPFEAMMEMKWVGLDELWKILITSSDGCLLSALSKVLGILI